MPLRSFQNYFKKIIPECRKKPTKTQEPEQTKVVHLHERYMMILLIFYDIRTLPVKNKAQI